MSVKWLSSRRQRGAVAIAMALTMIALAAIVSLSPAKAQEKSKKRVYIAMVETYSAIPFYTTVANGAKAAAADDGATRLVVRAPAVTNGTNEAGLARTLLATRPDGFAPNPCVLPAWTRVLRDMARRVKNRNLVTMNCKGAFTADQPNPVPTHVGPNDSQFGRKLATTTIREARLGRDTTGTALIANCFKGTPILDDRNKGYEAAIKSLLPRVKIVNFNGSVDQAKNTSTWTSQLQANSDVVLAMGPCDADTASLLTIKSKDRNAKYAVGVADPATRSVLRAIKSGVITAGGSDRPWVQGYLAVRLLADGARRNGPVRGWIDTGYEPITKSNVDTFIRGEASASAQRRFYTATAKRLLAGARKNAKPLRRAFS